MSNFKREERYLVFKNKDIEKYLDYKQIQQLESIAFQISLHRARDNKYVLKCVCIEHDWPEYESTWKAIEDRLNNE